MNAVKSISGLAEKKGAWTLLFCSALALLLCALYFQYVNELAPCIMCIYQRTAVVGIMLSALIVHVSLHPFVRMFGFIGWAVSSIWGLRIAQEHVEILTAANPFFATCEFVPNFPSWLQLHEWLPFMFAATGDCLENSWQFLSMGMAEWMRFIFAVYAGIFVLVFVCRLLDRKLF